MISRGWKMAAMASLIVVLVLFLTPYVWIFLTSFKTRLDALNDIPVWLFTPTFDHYPTIFLEKGYLPLVWNSLIVAIFSTGMSLVFGVPAAYVFGVRRFFKRSSITACSATFLWYASISSL